MKCIIHIVPDDFLKFCHLETGVMLDFSINGSLFFWKKCFTLFEIIEITTFLKNVQNCFFNAMIFEIWNRIYFYLQTLIKNIFMTIFYAYKKPFFVLHQ